MTTSAYVATPILTISGVADLVASGNLMSLVIEDSIVGMTWCEARLANYGYRNRVLDFIYLNRDVLDLGTELAVTLGSAADSRTAFSGRVSAIQADYPSGEQAQILIFAEDGLQALRMTRRTRTFLDASTADIAGQLAGEHGLTPKVDLKGPTRPVNAQLNQSDLAFLRGLARRDDAEVWLDGTDLHVAQRTGRSGQPVELAYGGPLVSFSVRADLADQVSEVAVTGWDVAAKEAINETAGPQALGAELASGDTSGTTALAAAFAERTENVTRSTPLQAEDAKALATAAYLQRARRFVCATGLTSGTPQLQVGSKVRLTGLGAMFNGEYYITRTRHIFDMALGYRTEFDAERPGIGAVS